MVQEDISQHTAVGFGMGPDYQPEEKNTIMMIIKKKSLQWSKQIQKNAI